MLGEQRSLGRQSILAEIRNKGRVPRIDLASGTGISPATVTTVTAELLSRGLIEEVPAEVDRSNSKRGRPRVDLKIRGDIFLVIGAKLASHSISILVADFEGQALCEHHVPLTRSTYHCDDFIKIFTTAIEEATHKAGENPARISAIGLGLSGLVDVEKAIVRWSPSLSERNVPLADKLSDYLGKPVFVDNDANLVAKAEQYFGMGKNLSDFLVVTIENGVGLGIVLGGNLYRGTRGCGAEFGHSKIYLDGALCRCGQRGCLEAYVADYALLREMWVEQDLTNEDKPTTIAHMIDMATEGDRRAQSILTRAKQIFALGLSNLINIFDPELIILSGERMQFDFLYEGEMLDYIKDTTIQVGASPPRIVLHKWGDTMWVKGATAYAIEELSKLTLKEMVQNGS